MSTNRIDRIVDAFVRSEYFANWQQENIEACGWAISSDDRDRADRCYEAAADGADGSTHYEAINDMRNAFKDWLRDKRHNRPFAEFPYRVLAAVEQHWDDLEAWHEANGSLHQEIG